jgi:hypothetical protein
MQKISKSPSEISSHLYSLLVPAEILSSFCVHSIAEQSELLIIELWEDESLNPSTALGLDLVQNGFMNYIELQSFPVQGKSCYLRLRRRRWKEKATGKGTYYNQYVYASEGTKATKSFGNFLKSIGW